MPIYEYQCDDCQREFEQLVLPSDREISCPTCDGTNLKRQISLFSTRADSSNSPVSSAGGCGCTPKTCGCH